MHINQTHLQLALMYLKLAQAMVVSHLMFMLKIRDSTTPQTQQEL